VSDALLIGSITFGSGIGWLPAFGSASPPAIGGIVIGIFEVKGG
jgi:hypothetical protein